MKNPTFKIGQWVKVEAIVSVDYDSKGNRKIYRFKTTGIGQIIGAKKRQLGVGRASIRGHDLLGYHEYEPAFLEISRVITVWQIKTGYINKPIEALEEDIKTLWEYDEFLKERKLPWLYARHHWPQSAKDELSEESKSWPRNEKGQWIKQSLK
jgi:hypothetical protein